MKIKSLSDPALILAAVRASGGLDVRSAHPDSHRAARKAAADSGRMLADCSVAVPAQAARGTAPAQAIIFRWLPQSTPAPEDSQAYPVRALPPISRLTWACCLGLAWPRRSDDPYPGEPFTRAAVVDTAADLGAGATWVKAALDHDLALAGLVMADPGGGEGDLRLGPAAAALPEPWVEAMRRFHERLPRIEPPPGDTDDSDGDRDPGEFDEEGGGR